MERSENEQIKLIVEKGIFEIKVIPKSSENKIYLENDKIKVKIREVPEDGKANKAVIDLFSKTFKIPKKNVEIVSGLKSSKKILIFK